MAEVTPPIYPIHQPMYIDATRRASTSHQSITPDFSQYTRDELLTSLIPHPINAAEVFHNASILSKRVFELQTQGDTIFRYPEALAPVVEKLQRMKAMHVLELLQYAREGNAQGMEVFFERKPQEQLHIASVNRIYLQGKP